MTPAVSRLIDKIDKFVDHMGRQADEIEGCGAGNIADEMQQDLNDAKLAITNLKKELANGPQ